MLHFFTIVYISMVWLRFVNLLLNSWLIGWFCMFVFPHDISKTDAARITKLDVEMFHDESWKPIYSGVRRSKIKVMSTRTLMAWVFALLWVLATSSWSFVVVTFDSYNSLSCSLTVHDSTGIWEALLRDQCLFHRESGGGWRQATSLVSTKPVAYVPLSALSLILGCRNNIWPVKTVLH